MIKGIFGARTIITIQLHCTPNSITENNNVDSTESEQMTVVVKKKMSDINFQRYKANFGCITEFL